MNTPLVRGRQFNSGDTTKAPFVAIVNEAFVRTFFKGEDPIGKRLRVMDSHRLGLVLLGLIFGLGGAFALTRLMRSLLFEITPTDPLTYVAVPVVLFVVAVVACLLPARRAIRIDPMAALRYE